VLVVNEDYHYHIPENLMANVRDCVGYAEMVTAGGGLVMVDPWVVFPWPQKIIYLSYSYLSVIG